MCELCEGGNIKKSAQTRINIEVNHLMKLARMLERVADGEIEPHTDDAKIVSACARNAIRYLVEDWM